MRDPPMGTAATCARTVPAGCVGVGVGVDWVGAAEDLVGADGVVRVAGGVDGAGLVVVPLLRFAERGDGVVAGVEGADAEPATDVVGSEEPAADA
jgi:hypothetical protein